MLIGIFVNIHTMKPCLTDAIGHITSARRNFSNGFKMTIVFHRDTIVIVSIKTHERLNKAFPEGVGLNGHCHDNVHAQS